jgi:hypothetical protein
MGLAIYALLASLIVFFIFKYSTWNWGVIGLFIVALGCILIFFDSDLRRLALFVLLTLYLATDFTVGIFRLLTTNARVVAAIRDSAALSFLLDGTTGRFVWSLVLGFTLALLVMLTLLFILAFVSSFYVLALHKMDGVSWWDAMRYIVTLILGINWSYIIVENGQAVITKEAAKLGVIGGPGHLIIKQGNVVVLERGGKITRIVNAGVVKLTSLETIRNIFPLGAQSNSEEIEHILTKDRIPLKITISIGFQIEPVSEADKRLESRIESGGEALTPKLDDGLYQVYEGTIRKAALMAQTTSWDKLIIEKCEGQTCYNVEETGWKKVAGGVPGGELRDYIMSHRFDELFELADSKIGEKPEARVNKRKIYEIEQAILEQIRPGKAKGLGVFVRGVDIGKIIFPPEARDLLLHHWGAPWQQQIDLIGVETRVQGGLLEAQKDVEVTDFRSQAFMINIRAEAQKRLMEAQGRMEIAELEGRVELTTAELKAQKIVIEARAKAQAKILEGQGEAEARAAFFREVLREIRREDVLGDDEMVAAVLRQLISTMVSVQDLQTFIKATAFMTQPPRTPLSAGLGGININNVESMVSE